MSVWVCPCERERVAAGECEFMCLSVRVSVREVTSLKDGCKWAGPSTPNPNLSLSQSHSLKPNFTLSLSHTHTHTHTHSLSHTHAHTHAHTHTRTHARTHARTHTHTNAYTRTRTHTHAHTRIHTRPSEGRGARLRVRCVREKRRRAHECCGAKVRVVRVSVKVSIDVMACWCLRLRSELRL